MREEKIIEIVANGLGGPSMLQFYLACVGELPPRVSITADTGSEIDRQTNKGERVTARDFFDNVVKPMGDKHGVDARFVRSQDENKNDLPPLWHDVRAAAATDVPLFGAEGGRLKQTCTDKWKMRAIKQEARRMGATMLISAIGLHVNEVMRRAQGRQLGKTKEHHGRFTLFQNGQGKGNDWTPIHWMRHYYPLADMRLSRDIIQEKLDALGIPYLLTSECDMCPRTRTRRVGCEHRRKSSTKSPPRKRHTTESSFSPTGASP